MQAALAFRQGPSAHVDVSGEPIPRSFVSLKSYQKKAQKLKDAQSRDGPWDLGRDPKGWGMGPLSRFERSFRRIDSE